MGGFLQEIGHEPEASRKAVDRGLERIEEWYVGEGWYTDGDGRKFDYYNGWAMHLYPVLHAWLADDSRLLDLYGGRLSRHLEDYARLFGGDGAPMHQGRSLTYRFATTVPLWLGALTGRTPLPAGGDPQAGLRGAEVLPGARRGGLPRPADARLAGPDSAVLQGYSGPASPYWASKGFLGLLLPPDHPVWTAAEEPGPAERSDALTAISAPNWLLQSTSSDGVVRLHNHGSEDVRYDPYYTRLAYSTVTEPSSSYDNSVIVGDDPSRTDIEPLGVGEGWVASRHTAGGGARVTSVVLARGAVEVRAHLVAGAEPRDAGTGDGVGDGGPPARADPRAGEGRRGPNSCPAVGLSEALTGVTGEGDTFFVALARLTGEPEPVPLAETVSVRADGERELSVRWSDGTGVRVRWGGSGVEIVPTDRG